MTNEDQVTGVRVMAYSVYADDALCESREVTSWLSRGWLRWMSVSDVDRIHMQHPVLLRVAGVGIGDLAIMDGFVRLRNSEVRVGTEADVLPTFAECVTDRAPVVTYAPEPGGVEFLLFRLLSNHRLPKCDAQLDHIRDLAGTVCLERQTPTVPVSLAAAAMAGYRGHALLSAREIAAAQRGGRWSAIGRDILERMNMTAALYCELTGLGASKYRSHMTDGYPISGQLNEEVRG